MYSQLPIECAALTFSTDCDVLLNHIISPNSDLSVPYLN